MVSMVISQKLSSLIFFLKKDVPYNLGHMSTSDPMHTLFVITLIAWYFKSWISLAPQTNYWS